MLLRVMSSFVTAGSGPVDMPPPIAGGRFANSSAYSVAGLPCGLMGAPLPVQKQRKAPVVPLAGLLSTWTIRVSDRRLPGACGRPLATTWSSVGPDGSWYFDPPGALDGPPQ